MSCLASAAWSRLVLSLCCTEPGPSRGAVLLGHITTVPMSRSSQLGLRCTVELNCSGLSARLTGASVTLNRTLDTCKPSSVPGAARLFFIPMVHSPLGAVGYVAAPELSSRGGEAIATWQRQSPTSAGRRGPELRNTWQHRSSTLGEAEPGAMGHVAAPEPTSAGRRGPELRNTWRRRSSTQQGDEARGHGPRGSTEAHLSKEVRPGVAGHVAALEPTSAGRCGSKLQLM
jgi:hypothetical protein